MIRPHEPGSRDVKPPLRVLLVEDSESDALLTVRALERGGYDLTFERVDDRDAMHAAIEARRWDLIITDWFMPGFSALGALEVARERAADIPVIVVSGTVGEETAIEALHAGAHDFVIKGKLTRLLPAVQRELREAEARAAAEAALRKSEEQLRQSQKMEAVGQLAGGIAHDFNNMLSVVLGFADLILSDLKEDDPTRADVEEIKKAGLGASNLTRQLLAFSRRQVLQPIPLDLVRVVQGMEKMLRRLLGASVELTLVGSPALWRVKADPGQIEQVVMNLAVNARDAMPGGGKLTIEARNVELSEEDAIDHVGVAPGAYVSFAVSDTGIGMDPETQARIFEPFFTTKEKGRGTGLGLSTVFGIVSQSGGSIAVHSEPGGGTTFKIYLPRTEDAPRSGSSPPISSVSPGGSETILLVENDEQVRAVAREILLRHGYHVLEATSPGDAIVVCEQHKAKIHLLLTDVVLPRMSGRALAERLAPMRPEMKVLFMSGHAGDAALHQVPVDPDAPFLEKPLRPSTLTSKVREALRR
jgi:two-component system cell cycle sensor histidine kinase/response regulator CckA